MANIETFTITSPPNTLFQGISTDYQDNLTYVEYLLGVLKKLNEVIVQTNSNTSFIEDYDGRIEAVEREIALLRAEMTEFESGIDTKFQNLENELLATIDQRLVEIRSELITLITVYRAEAKAYTDQQIANVEEEINNILLGQIQVHDPTTGLTADLQTVINNIYDSTREEALTATEYDALELTATTYDGYEITAFNYDQYGKTILTA